MRTVIAAAVLSCTFAAPALAQFQVLSREGLYSVTANGFTEGGTLTLADGTVSRAAQRSWSLPGWPSSSAAVELASGWSPNRISFHVSFNLACDAAVGNNGTSARGEAHDFITFRVTQPTQVTLRYKYQGTANPWNGSGGYFFQLRSANLLSTIDSPQGVGPSYRLDRGSGVGYTYETSNCVTLQPDTFVFEPAVLPFYVFADQNWSSVGNALFEVDMRVHPTSSTISQGPSVTCPGGTLVLTSSVGPYSGYGGPFNMQWSRDDGAPLTDPRITINGHVLTITNAQPSDSGVYRFFSMTDCGVIPSTPITVRIGGCSRADLTDLGGVASCGDGRLTGDDIAVFIAAFFDGDLARADIAALGGAPVPDGRLTADDVISFLSAFFAGCV